LHSIICVKNKIERREEKRFFWLKDLLFGLIKNILWWLNIYDKGFREYSLLL